MSLIAKQGLSLLWVLFLCCFQGMAAPQSELVLPDSVISQPIEQQLAYLDHVGNDLEHTDPVAAIEYFRKGLDMAIEEGNPRYQGSFSLRISFILFHFGDYHESLTYALQGYEIGEKSDDLQIKAWATHRIALIYADLGDWNNAETYAKLNLKAREEIGSLNGLGLAYNIHGEVYRLRGDYAKAKSYYLKADSFFVAAKRTGNRMMVRHNLGVVAAASGKYQEGLDSLAVTDGVTDPGNHKESAIEAYIAMSGAYAGLQRWDQAESILDSALVLARESGILKFEQDILDQKAKVYRKQGKWEQAWQAREEALEVKERRKGIAVQMQSTMSGLVFDKQRIESENRLLQEQKKSQNIILASLAAILLLIVFIGFSLWRNNRQARKVNQRLESQNQQLDRLNEEKDMLMKVVAHDLKSPLSNIAGMIGLLDRVQDNPSMREQLMERIRSSLNRGTDLIENLLELSSLESGVAAINWEPVDLDRLCQEVCGHHLNRAKQKEIDLHVEVPSSVQQTVADPSHVSRILDNLLSNALKYSPKGKEVYFRLKEHPQTYSIQVIDQGPGISPEEQKKLFHKFEKLSNRPTDGESSTGLGLAIVKALSEQLGAELSVASQVGKGSTFELILPKRHKIPA